MFRIKICGVMTADDAALIVAAGADAIGINFYPLSPRYVDEHQAAEIVAVQAAGVARVGVFVNSTSAEVRTIASRLALDYVQIHGDEPPEFLRELDGLATIRALRCSDGVQSAVDYLDACQRIGSLPQAVLIDAHCPGQFGGTGQTADWQALAADRNRLPPIPLILAGGLKPANVAEAIEMVHPAAVDTASGVESAPGKKSAALVQAFVAAARAAMHPARAE